MRFVISLLLFFSCTCFAREDSLTSSDVQAVTGKLVKLVGRDAESYILIASETGCHDLEPCTDVVDRYATFERTVSEPNPLVTRTTSVECHTPPKITSWTCEISPDDMLTVPNLYPRRFFINTGNFNRKSEPLDDDAIIALVRFIMSSCYEKQRIALNTKEHLPMDDPMFKFNSIGMDKKENSYTVSRRAGFWSDTVLLQPTDNKSETCPFNIVGYKAGVA
ncbi:MULTISPECIES: hypothetical protein [Variovorax]|uniref:hypothetical protein n=1 Tax=Variovorax TaxID=34072 RepID=UPI00115FAB5B|nr:MULTISPECIES: hypothetical protein [Variovorax]MDQ0086580.1 hypothetical protein [Variovorax boronicumulans]